MSEEGFNFQYDHESFDIGRVFGESQRGIGLAYPGHCNRCGHAIDDHNTDKRCVICSRGRGPCEVAGARA